MKRIVEKTRDLSISAMDGLQKPENVLQQLIWKLFNSQFHEIHTALENSDVIRPVDREEPHHG